MKLKEKIRKKLKIILKENMYSYCVIFEKG